VSSLDHILRLAGVGERYADLKVEDCPWDEEPLHRVSEALQFKSPSDELDKKSAARTLSLKQRFVDVDDPVWGAKSHYGTPKFSSVLYAIAALLTEEPKAVKTGETFVRDAKKSLDPKKLQQAIKDRLSGKDRGHASYGSFGVDTNDGEIYADGPETWSGGEREMAISQAESSAINKELEKNPPSVVVEPMTGKTGASGWKIKVSPAYAHYKAIGDKAVAAVEKEYAAKKGKSESINLDEAHPLGTVHSRKDGDWIKTADGWVRVTKKLKASMGSAAPSPAQASAPPPKAPAPPKETATAKAKAALKKTASVYDKNPNAKVSVGSMLAMPKPKPEPAPALPPAPAPPKPASGPLTDEERAKAAEEIMPIVNKAMQALGDSYDKAEFNGKVVQASFRSWDLPKDPPSDPSDWDDEDGEYDSDGGDYYAYEEQVSKVLKGAYALLKSKLADVADKVDKVFVEMGDKNYVEVAVKLK
jgi:hypothetical protein